jgi:hypothetical protein
MMEAFSEHLGKGSGIREVIVAVFDTPQFNAFEAALAARS